MREGHGKTMRKERKSQELDRGEESGGKEGYMHIWEKAPVRETGKLQKAGRKKKRFEMLSEWPGGGGETGCGFTRDGLSDAREYCEERL